MNAQRPNATDRLYGAGYYLGLAPLIGFWRPDSSSLFLQHHFKQAMAAFFVAFSILMVACVFEGAECFVVIVFPGLIRQLVNRFGSPLSYLDDAEMLLFAALAFFWIILLGLAIAGSLWSMPLLGRISRNPFFVRLSLGANALGLILIPVTFVFALWATTLTRRSTEGAEIYFLYDEGIAVPRWAYAMGLSRLSLQAQWNWGKGSTVLDRLNRETLRTALACGRVVILATHGEAGYVATYFAPEVLGVWPAESGVTDETGGAHFLRVGTRGVDRQWSKAENVKMTSQLRLVYLFACNTGTKASQWEEHLAPAQVVTYDRYSTILDHAFWFAFTGPSELKRLR